MASALASPPPPFPGGASDLEGNARRFLERALLISALVHFTAVGVFRAADERNRVRWERDNPAVKTWDEHVILSPPLLPPRIFGPGPAANATTGEIVPFDRRPIFEFFEKPGGGEMKPEGVPFRGAVDRGGPGPPDPPGEEPAAFTYADTPPEPLTAPRPQYPPWAREAGIEGKVLVRVLVGADGIPKKAVIVRGPKGLTEGVESAVLRWTFRPGLANGRPVEVWVEIPIVFQLRD